MAEKKEYRVSQIEGKVTWQIEELWEGGVARGPYGHKDAAIKGEEKIARENGFFDDLVLQDSDEEAAEIKNSFEKDPEGNWHCILACTIEMGEDTIAFEEGETFTKGAPKYGIDVAEWLDENVSGLPSK